MKIVTVACAGLILSFCVRAEAQVLPDTIPSVPFLASDTAEDAEARRILDDPGISDLDPDEAEEYLDGLATMAHAGLTTLHAIPTISWTEAHELVRKRNRMPVDGVSSALSFRSRESEPMNADAQQGYITDSYLGTPLGLYNQIRATSSLLTLGAMEQKQSWEPSFTEHLGGYAALREPIQITNSFGVEQAVAGDYALAFGNGLAFGDGMNQSQSRAAAAGVEQRSFGIRGTLRNSAKSLRGGAVELMVGPSHLFVFASDRPVDANVVNDTIRTIYSTGLHRTQSELSFADAATIRAIGARAEVANPETDAIYIKGGASAYELNYNHPYRGSASVPFIGSQIGVASADVLAIGEKWSSSAELALSANDTIHQMALSISSMFAPAKNFAFSVMYSHVPLGYFSPFGEASGVGTSSISNLDGYYFGIELEPVVNRVRINAYARLETEIIPMSDLFGKQKHDYLFSATYRVSKGLDFRATIRDEQDATVVSDTSSTGYATVQGETMHVRLEAAYHPGTASFRTRFEEVRYVLTNVEGGWSLAEEVRIPAPAIHSDLNITTTRFETGSSSAAMWLYESGAPGTATINTLDGLGWRIALRTTTHLTHTLSCSASLAGTIYDSPRTLGSGLTARTGTTDLMAAVQIDVRL